MTSGSWRSAALRPSPKLLESAPSSRWLTMQRLCLCRNSIGSSIVRMCSWRVSLIRSSIAASVVDLPEPVGPVTSTKPRGFLVNSSSTVGRPRSRRFGIVLRDQAEGRRQRRALHVGVDAEARLAGDRVGEVDLPVVLQPLTLVVAEDRVDHLARDLRGQLRVVHRLELSVVAQHRRRAGRQVKVGGVALHHLQQHVCEIELHRHLLSTFLRVHVTLATSLMDVMPFLTFSKPSARSGRMPCETATFLISSAEERSIVSSRMSSLIAITS